MPTPTVPRRPLPPFTRETVVQKVRLAEDAWNTRDPQRVALAYTADTIWRIRAEFPVGREQVQAFLERKWARELTDPRIRVALAPARRAVWPAPVPISSTKEFNS